MSGIGALVFDLFEGICETALMPSEVRLLKMRCGLRTGYPPMDIPELALRLNLTREKINKRIAKALVKLPRNDLERLKSYLGDEHHRYLDFPPFGRVNEKYRTAVRTAPG